ncbi:1748_t:CDS:2 [Diversispora eburnea]|uniref:1748_t:CDS:1 n=1 Tax=Diversispora eburnea TaxID=1213867 RepID=A0A9N8ZBA1_9GLOM|nr:1748_t:CDS:2 [Diversispora eburnea]
MANNIDFVQHNNFIENTENTETVIITQPLPIASRENSLIIIDTECLPSYSSVLKDPPPNYHNSIIDSYLVLIQQPQIQWSRLKKLYIFGYIFWPFWFIGTLYLFSDYSDNRFWAKRCLMTYKNGSTGTSSYYISSPLSPTGNTILPVTRVKRIIKEDNEVKTCGADVTFLITVAAEIFIEYFMRQGLEQAKSENRKNVNYQDLEIVPQTCTYEKAIKLYDKAMEMRNTVMLTDDDESGDESKEEEEYSEDNCDENIDDQSNDDGEQGDEENDINNNILSEDENRSSIDVIVTSKGQKSRLIDNNYIDEENGVSSDSELSEVPETSISENSSITVLMIFVNNFKTSFWYYAIYEPFDQTYNLLHNSNHQCVPLKDTNNKEFMTFRRNS